MACNVNPFMKRYEGQIWCLVVQKNTSDEVKNSYFCIINVYSNKYYECHGRENVPNHARDFEELM